MNSKSIILFIDRFGSGGAQTQMSLLCQGLVQRGYEVALVTYYPSDLSRHSEYISGARLVELRKRGRWDPSVAIRLAQIITQLNPIALISFLATPNFYAAIASTISQFRGTLVLGERTSFPKGAPTRLQSLQRLALRRATWIVTNSYAQQTAIRNHFPAVDGKLRTVWNCVDLARFRFILRPKSPSTTTLLSVGRIVPDKNVHGLIAAIDFLRTQQQHVHVVWAGKVYDHEYFRRCQESLKSLSLQERWTWLPETSQIEEAYTTAQFFVHPSFHEGLPNVVTEALASGLPCAISNVGDAARLMQQGQNGRVFEPSEPTDIAHAISSLLQLEAKDYAAIQRSARLFSETHLNPDTMVSAYEELFAVR
ncbi:MAG: glycosyltransferase family 4 protein [Hyphomonadaceae bacterium]|nr:glycosyltransferase family 4 protein [Hyphomonadaceae bacterium]